LDHSQTPRELARRLLGRASGFRDCRPELLDELVQGSQLRHLNKGEYVMRRGDGNVHVGMAVRGQFESSMLRADGGRHLQALLLPGAFFGLVGFLDATPHTHDISAREDGECLMIPPPLLHALRDRDCSVVRACERQVVDRMHLLIERMAVDSSVPLEARVASMLNMLGNQHGVAQANGHVVIDVKLSQADLADWLGLSRQRVNFALKQLADEGLISRQYAALTLLDPAGLRARAAY
jgi:CRP-like cAMP-binding protein